MAKKPTGKNTSGRGQRDLKVKVKSARGRTTSSTRWLQRQLNDPYVKRAKDEGYRGRAAFKILELDEKYRFLVPGARVVDLGCAPGGWIQVCQRRGVSEIVGIDLLAVDPIPEAHIVQGDINEAEDVAKMMEGLSGPPDLILSDMAANTTGHKQTDSLRTAALAETALWFASEHLVQGGNFCSKVFQGGATPELLGDLKRMFKTVKHVKPPASRAGSPELFVVALGFRGRS